jgi:hypothetical protein
MEGEIVKELEIKSEIIPWFRTMELFRLYPAKNLTSELMASMLFPKEKLTPSECELFGYSMLAVWLSIPLYWTSYNIFFQKFV